MRGALISAQVRACSVAALGAKLAVDLTRLASGERISADVLRDVADARRTLDWIEGVLHAHDGGQYFAVGGEVFRTTLEPPHGYAIAPAQASLLLDYHERAAMTAAEAVAADAADYHVARAGELRAALNRTSEWRRAV